MNARTLIVIAGPTASGKTDAAIKLAKQLNTVIVSADSRQLYKEMSIGTAVRSLKELHKVKHYFIQNISILSDYDVADYERDALKLLNLLFKEHDQVVMAGGSGLYIDAVCRGIDLMPDITLETRQRVTQLFEEKGLAGLHGIPDPAAATHRGYGQRSGRRPYRGAPLSQTQK